jgi:uncharacterized membrane-anchored protein
MAWRPIRYTTVCLSLLGALAAGAPAASQEAEPVALQWTRGPGTAPIGADLAEIQLGENYVFLDAAGTARLMELTQNPVSGQELATVAPVSDDEHWFLIFEFDEVGYVSDEEKNSLDADAMLASIREGTEQANKERSARGWPTMRIVGWHEKPHYDQATNNLSWAIIGEGDGGRAINRIVKILGRRGVMTATLVASPDELAAAVPHVDALLDAYTFRPGHTYAEFVPGKDKLAKYGLTALVVGGVGAALVKSGLLAKLWKPLVVGLGALGAGVKRFFFGGRSAQHDPERPIV